MPIDPLYQEKYWLPNEENEQTFIDDQYNEYIATFGSRCYYYPVALSTNRNVIFGDDTEKRYAQRYVLKAWHEPIDHAQQTGKFGVTDLTSITLYLPKTTFLDVVGVVPVPGDWLILPTLVATETGPSAIINSSGVYITVQDDVESYEFVPPIDTYDILRANFIYEVDSVSEYAFHHLTQRYAYKITAKVRQFSFENLSATSATSAAVYEELAAPPIDTTQTQLKDNSEIDTIKTKALTDEDASRNKDRWGNW